jgi:hypothetical protein
MAAATPQQLGDITAAIEKIDAYVKQLIAAQRKAAEAGLDARAKALNLRYNEARILEQHLGDLYTITAVDSLNEAIASIKQTTKTLNDQRNQIDQIVKAVGIAADVANLIASIATAVALL